MGGGVLVGVEGMGVSVGGCGVSVAVGEAELVGVAAGVMAQALKSENNNGTIYFIFIAQLLFADLRTVISTQQGTFDIIWFIAREDADHNTGVNYHES